MWLDEGGRTVAREQGWGTSVDRILTPVRIRPLRGFLLVSCILALLVPGLALGQDDRPRVLAAHLDNDINPVTQEYVEGAIDRAEDEQFDAVVVILDTPGGLSSSMRGIVKKFLASTVPVILYVAPPGSSADSAGAVIAMASDIAAMAPQTNIGSSTPVSLQGEDISEDLRRKIVNDAAAYVGELAREHERNVPAARRMVTKASNYGARQAEAIGLIEVVSPTLTALLNEVDGMKTVPKGLVLKTAGAEVEEIEMSFWQRARDLLVDPNLITLMLSIGLIGIVVELWNPGLIFPGTVGAISLILGLYGLQVLPVSLAGLFLMLLAAALLRRRGVRAITRSAHRRRRSHVRARRADPLRPGRRGVPGVASRGHRHRSHACAPHGLRTDQGGASRTTACGRRRAWARGWRGSRPPRRAHLAERRAVACVERRRRSARPG